MTRSPVLVTTTSLVSDVGGEPVARLQGEEEIPFNVLVDSNFNELVDDSYYFLIYNTY